MRLVGATALCLLFTAMQASAGGAQLRALPGGSFLPLYAAPGDTLEVVLAPFRLAEHAVTNAEYLDFVTARPEWRRSNVSPLFADENYLRHWRTDLDPGDTLRAPLDSPVCYVSWFAARAYAAWRGGRLPGTAEWEYAAGSGTGRADPELRQRILDWYAKPSRHPLPPVRSTFETDDGIWDLHGLVWEWVEDFNSALVTGESRADSDLDRKLFCAGGAVSATDLNDYAAFMRYAFRSSLGGRDCIASLGFRCAADTVIHPLKEPRP